jgi:hypothetical protein
MSESESAYVSMSLYIHVRGCVCVCVCVLMCARDLFDIFMCVYAYVCINSLCYICTSHVRMYTYSGMNVSVSACAVTFVYMFTCIDSVYVSSVLAQHPLRSIASSV